MESLSLQLLTSLRVFPRKQRSVTSLGVLLLAALFSLDAVAASALLAPDRAVAPSLAQYVRKAWQTEDGLPQNSVSSVAQTRDGYLWLGTEAGLARFDGLQFEVFDKDNTPQLASSKISTLLVDGNDVLWIGTHGGGLSCYRNRRFESPPGNEHFTAETILSLHADKQGALWIGTEGNGFFRLREGKLSHFGLNEGLPANSVFSISSEQRGSIWVGTQKGLARLSPGASRLVTIPLRYESEAVKTVYVDRKDKVWAGTQNGLFLREGGSSEPFRAIPGLQGLTVSSVLEDSAHSLWVGTLEAGLQHLAGGILTETFKGAGVWSMLQDKAGALWVGTTNSGLLSFRPGLFTPLAAAEGLAGDVSLAVYQDRSGAIWLGSDRGLTRWNAGTATTFSTKDGLPGNLVFSVTQDGSGTIWAGTAKGLARLEGARFIPYGADKGVPVHGAITSSLTDEDGSLWIGYRGGISHLANSDRNVFQAAQGFADRIVTSIVRDQHHRLWAGTDGGGLFLMAEGGQPGRCYRTPDGLPSNVVYALLPEKDGSLWLGTSNGLSQFSDGTIRTLTKAGGLFDDEVFEILDDRLGNLWLSSNRGIQKIDKAEVRRYLASPAHTVSSQTFSLSDGMRSRECNGGFQPAGWRTTDGRLWFPTMKGTVSIDPRRTLVSAAKFSPVVEAVLVDNKTSTQLGGIQIPPGRRQIEFHFTAPGVENPDKLRFFYQLRNFDRDWVSAGARRVGYYTNLPPGKFDFRVRACVYQRCEETQTSLPVVVQPAFYETVWFGLILTTLAGATAFALHQVRVWQLRQSERKLLALVDERTQELRRSRDELDAKVQERTAELSVANSILETEVEVRKAAESKANAASRAKSEFLTNMSHEIRTPINGIMGMTELAFYTELDAEQTEYLEIIKTSADSLLRIVNDILDFSEIEARKLDFETIPFRLSEVIEQLKRLLVLRAAEKGLYFDASVAPEIPDALVGDPGRLRQVLLNLLENALKFTQSGGVKLSVALISLANNSCVVEFAVADTGMGIAPETKALIFDAFSQADYSSTRKFGGLGLGLAICKQLVQLMNGQIHVDSSEGVGSTFRFTATFRRRVEDGGTALELVA